EPADGGDELCSLAPAEVSALPDGGTVADLDASGDVVLAVGGFVGVSAAKVAAIPMDKTKAVVASKRIMSLSFLVCPPIAGATPLAVTCSQKTVTRKGEHAPRKGNSQEVTLGNWHGR